MSIPLRLSIALLAPILAAFGQKAAERVPWDRTPQVLAGKRVVVELNDGTKVEGAWLAVAASAFTMKVEKSSGPGRRAKGSQSLDRSEIRRVWFGERRVRGRVLGTIGGFYAVMAIAAAATGAPDAFQGGWGIAAVAAGVGGYQLGKVFDRSLREVIIEP